MPVPRGGGRHSKNVSSGQRKMSPIVRQTLVNGDVSPIPSYCGIDTNGKVTERLVCPSFIGLLFRGQNQDSTTTDDGASLNNSSVSSKKNRGPTPAAKRILRKKQQQQQRRRNSNESISGCTFASDETVRGDNSTRTRKVSFADEDTFFSSSTKEHSTRSRKRNLKKRIKQLSAADKKQ